jgi:eukaryotic-like serine/threonine-protein kinase
MNPLLTVLTTVDQIAARSGLLPEFEGRSWVLLVAAASMLIGLVAGVLYWLSSLRMKSPAEQLRNADALVRSGNFERAKQIFVEQKHFSRAAQMAQRAGKKEEALEYARLAGDHSVAAQLLSGMGRHEDAAKAYEAARQFGEAGDHWMKAGQAEAALTNYRSAGLRRKVLELLERTGRQAELAEVLAAEYFKERQAMGLNPGAMQVERCKELASKAGEAYIKCGETQKAYELFLKSGDSERAAYCLERLGQNTRASDLYFQAGKPAEAARVLVDAGEFDRAIDLYDELNQLEKVPEVLRKAGKVAQAKAVEARLAINRGDREVAAQLFADGNEPSQAAELFDEMGNYPMAAEQWEKAGSLHEAAGAYERAGDLAKAADLYSKSNRHPQAAVCYEKIGNTAAAEKEYASAEQFYDAGRIAIAAECPDRAVTYFQQVPAESEYIFESRHHLANIFWKQGLLKLADENFRALTKGASVTRSRIEAFYDYALFLEEQEEFGSACEWLEKILSVDFHYKDALSRKKALESRLSTHPKRKPKPPADPSPSSSKRSEAFLPYPGAILLERYELKDLIGAGGMGAVYSAKDRKLGRDVALKFLSPTLLASEKMENLFLQEARLNAKLLHPNIVSFYDGGRHKGHLFLVMEFVKGRDLKKAIDESGPLSVEATVAVLRQLVSALDYAHEKQIVHRDLKSPNILVTGNWTSKIADFGLARVLNASNLTMTKALGSPYYMAPEQIKGGKYDHRVDLYSLGCVCYEMLTGLPPFTEGEVAYHHIHTEPSSVASKRPEVPKAIDEMILKLLKKSPDERYGNALELQTDLERFCHSTEP